jgi:hypothetical protein
VVVVADAADDAATALQTSVATINTKKLDPNDQRHLPTTQLLLLSNLE